MKTVNAWELRKEDTLRYVSAIRGCSYATETPRATYQINHSFLDYIDDQYATRLVA